MLEKEIKSIYNSAEWKHKRLEILERDCYECQDCRKRIEDAYKDKKELSARDRKIRRAEEVHHIKEIREFPELAFENDNLISLCKQCHNIRHRRNPYKFIRKKKRVTEEKW